MLRGIRDECHYRVAGSMRIRARQRTVRRIVAYHDIDHKAIGLAYGVGEIAL
jgi:hypothetical protein